MIEPRLTSEFQISAIKRLAEASGDFATILRRGDSTSGAILIIGQIRGRDPVIFDRFPSGDGTTRWQAINLQPNEKETEVADYWRKRVERDPDLWVLELDVASSERLSGLLTSAY